MFDLNIVFLALASQGVRKKDSFLKSLVVKFTDFIRFLSEVVQKEGNLSLSEQGISVLLLDGQVGTILIGDEANKCSSNLNAKCCLWL